MTSEVGLLLGLLATALLLVLALLAASRWHALQAARAVRAQEDAAVLLAGWAGRAPTPEELDRLSSLSRSDGRLLLHGFIRAMPGLAPEAAERARRVLSETGMLEREAARLRHRSAAARAEACRILGRLGQGEVIPPLVQRLRDADPGVRRSALRALGDLRAVEALGAAADAIEAEGKWDDLLAVMALARMDGGASQLGALLENARSPAMTKALLQITGRIGAVADPVRVRGLAAHPELEVRVEALRALGTIPPDPESVGVCLAAMDDAEWPARALAASSLGRLGDRRAVPRLQQAMGDTAYWVRHHAAEALAELGEEGEAALRQCLEDSNPFVRDMAAQVLYMRSAARGRAA